MNRPNILYLHSHDTGRYVQPYGHPVPTPNLQRFAEQGVLFRRAFCVAPTCSASRAGLLTGQSAHSSGMIGLAHRGFSLKDYKQHIVHTVRRAGYHSTLIGVQHVAKDPNIIGYDVIAQRKKPGDTGTVEAAAEFFNSAPRQPFFASVGFFLTHRKYPEPGPPEDPRYMMPPLPMPDTSETRYDTACFKASARMLDDAMGSVLKALDGSGLGENTLVICTTDHGIAWPYMKCNMTDNGAGVMLMMRWPGGGGRSGEGGFTGGRVIDALVSHIDVFPTVCELVGVERPAWLQGKSLMPLIRGETDEVNEAVFIENTYHAAYEPMRAVRTKRWKYIRRFGGRGRPVLPNCDDSLSKTLWMKHGWADRPLAEEELYDLVFDPVEMNNLAGEARAREALNEMRGRMDRWMKDTADPLLGGEPVPAPPEAVVNDPDGISPQEKPRAAQ